MMARVRAFETHLGWTITGPYNFGQMKETNMEITMIAIGEDQDVSNNNQQLMRQFKDSTTWKG